MCMYLSIHCSIDIRLEDPLPVATLGAIPSQPPLPYEILYVQEAERARCSHGPDQPDFEPTGFLKKGLAAEANLAS